MLCSHFVKTDFASEMRINSAEFDKFLLGEHLWMEVPQWGPVRVVHIKHSGCTIYCLIMKLQSDLTSVSLQQCLITCSRCCRFSVSRSQARSFAGK